MTNRAILATCFAVLLTGGCLKSSYATTLVPTQLRGLSRVALSIDTEGDVDESLRVRLNSAVTRAVLSQLDEAGLAHDSKSAETLEATIKIRYLNLDGNTSAAACLVSVRLKEPVRLLRDAALVVPDGGGLTWWADLVFASDRDHLESQVSDAVEKVLTDFLAGWKLENRASKAP